MEQDEQLIQDQWARKREYGFSGMDDIEKRKHYPGMNIFQQLEESKIIKDCQVCYRFYPVDTLIAVSNIAFQTGTRVTPWYICPECAQKISDALDGNT